MKKIIISIALFFFIALPAQAKLQLWEYKLGFDGQKELYYKNISDDIYYGTRDQNMALLDYLEYEELSFGGASGFAALPKIVANFETSLASRITSTDTSMTLVSGTDDAGTALSGFYGFTIDVNTSKQEYVIGNCTGTSCTSLTRGVSPTTGTSSVASLKNAHNRGASVSITNHPNLAILTNIMNGVETIPDKLHYASDVTIVSGDTTKTLITKEYADALAVAGASDATESVKGIVELATQAEMAAGTSAGGTSANLCLWSSYANATSTATTIIPITRADGDIDGEFIETDFAYTWTGQNTFSATTTLATSTITDLTVSGTSTLGATTISGTSTAALVAGGDANALHNHGVKIGIDTFAPTSAASSTVITHNLGRVPNLITITWSSDAINTNAWSNGTGMFDGTNYATVYEYVSGNPDQSSGTSNSKIIVIDSEPSSADWDATITNNLANSFTIDVANFTGAQSMKFSWKVE